MRLPDLESLEPLGLTLYERRALAALMLCGVADAATLCREGGADLEDLPSDGKLTCLGLAQSQPTRPKLFAAMPAEVVVSRSVEIARERAERFAAEAAGLREVDGPPGPRP